MPPSSLRPMGSHSINLAPLTLNKSEKVVATKNGQTRSLLADTYGLDSVNYSASGSKFSDLKYLHDFEFNLGLGGSFGVGTIIFGSLFYHWPKIETFGFYFGPSLASTMTMLSAGLTFEVFKHKRLKQSLYTQWDYGQQIHRWIGGLEDSSADPSDLDLEFKQNNSILRFGTRLGYITLTSNLIFLGIETGTVITNSYSIINKTTDGAQPVTIERSQMENGYWLGGSLGFSF